MIKFLSLKSIKPNIYPKKTLLWVRSENRHTELDQTSSYKEIDKYIEYLEKDLLWIRIKKASRQEFENSDMKLGRKKIAHLLTIRRRKQIEEGISRRIYVMDKKFKSNQTKTKNMSRQYQLKKNSNLTKLKQKICH